MKVKGMARNTFNSETLSLSLSMHWDNINEWLLGIITLDNKLKKKICICDEYVINLFVCTYEVRSGTLKKLLGSSFKIMLPL